MLRALYIIYICLVFVPVFLVLTLITALVTIVGCLLGGEKLFAYYPGMVWSRLTCYLALCPVRVKGREHIQPGQPVIFVANHQGAFDVFLIYGFLGVPVKWMMKASLRKIPFVGAACRAAGFIFVDNATVKSAARSVTEAEGAIRKGASVLVFPEGSRTYDGKMIRFKKGAFQMAVDQQVPVIPITLNGPYKVLPIDSIHLEPHRMEMVIHPPLSSEGVPDSPRSVQQFADQAQEMIASALWEEFKE
ncbi:MAG: 1-acyl-sn-glycerol-3-phosphate acyltransferase [Tannerellaceae bacterium]|nr:1-acyl-sn-glycerol-3-phosphate acyltransferase [Tannerellaceae bacterium]